jgi:hypothetical protein
MQKCVLDEMPMSVEILVIASFLFSVFARWDNHAHALRGGLLDDGITVVALVGQQVLGAKPFDQLRSLRAICDGTFRNKDSERHTKRIHGQM